MKKIIQNTTSQPQTKKELRALIRAEMTHHGYRCDLNHIDISLITDFYYFFRNSNFDGNISKWDVSSVTAMYIMFSESTLNGDISKWDISKWNISAVIYMGCMLHGSKFNRKLSGWDVSSATDMGSMFRESEFNGDVSNWNRSSVSKDEYMFLGSNVAKKIGALSPSFEQVKNHCLSLRLEADPQEVSLKQPKKSKVRL